MQNKSLNNKVLVSLLAMSCVYMGGTCVCPVAEAKVVLNGQNHASGTTIKYDADEKLDANGGVSNYLVQITDGGILNIEAAGNLELVGTGAGFNAIIDIDGTGSALNITGSKGKEIFAYHAGGTYFSQGLFVRNGALLNITDSVLHIGVQNLNTNEKNVEATSGMSVDKATANIEGIVIDLSGDKYKAYGIYVSGSDDKNSGKLLVNNDVTVNIEGGTELVYGMSLNGVANADIKGNLNLNVINDGSFVSGSSLAGLALNSRGYLNVAEDVNISVAAENIVDTAKVYGVQSSSSETIHVGGALNVTVSSNAVNTGIQVMNGDLKVEGSTNVNVSHTGNSAGIKDAGLLVANSSRENNAVFNGSSRIIVDADGGSALKVLGSTVKFNGDTLLASGVDSGSGLVYKKDNYAILLGSNAGGNVHSTVVINENAVNKVQIMGDIANDKSSLDINFSTNDSFLEGAVKEGLTGKTTLNFTNAAQWKVAGDSNVRNLILNNNAVIDMRSDNNTYSTLVTNKLSGTGGVIKLDIDVRSDDSDKIEVKDNFSGSQIIDIYQKDNYVPLADSTEGHGLVLASVNGAGEFTAKDREGNLFYTHYDLAKKASAESDYDFDWYLDKIIKLDPDDQTTTSVETILSANALNYHTWRTENDKLLQRMGELRNNGENAQGAWFKVSGSKIGRSGRFDFANKYTGYELGYDEVTKRTEAVTRYQGVALSYTDGSSGYSRGSGDNSGKGISFYNTELGSKGHYLDVVLKISNMDSDFAVYDTDSKKITGDFNNTGVALSAEYGRKNALHNGWYIEPQAQFTLGYLGGDSYTASNGIEVSQSGIKSAVGRIGFNIGREVGSKGVVYAKANLLHEFGGGYEVAMHDGSGAVTVSESFRDTWFEYGIGAALQTGKNNQIYFDVERSGGSEFKKDWQWNIGARWMF